METMGLYKVVVFRNGKQKATAKVIAWSRRDAYWEVRDKMPVHDTFDATRIRDAKDNEAPGVVADKNFLKRKISN